MNNQNNMRDFLFYYENKHSFQCADNKNLKNGVSFPAGYMYCDARENNTELNTKRAVKVNSIVDVLESIFITKDSNAMIEFDKAIYCEFIHNGKEYACEFNGKELSYFKEQPETYGNIFPVVFWAISDLSNNPEFKKEFSIAASEFNAYKKLANRTIAILCDTLYFEVIPNLPDKGMVEILENNISKEMIKKAYKENNFEPIPILSTICNKPFKIFTSIGKDKNIEER